MLEQRLCILARRRELVTQARKRDLTLCDCDPLDHRADLCDRIRMRVHRATDPHRSPRGVKRLKLIGLGAKLGFAWGLVSGSAQALLEREPVLLA